MAVTLNAPSPTRRALLGAFTLPWLVGGCSTPLPLGPLLASDADASARLRDSAEAHGLAAYRGLTDINVSYSGQWRPLTGRIQTVMPDHDWRVTGLDVYRDYAAKELTGSSSQGRPARLRSPCRKTVRLGYQTRA